MDIYVGRQPIFDRSMNIYGYELFYRRSEKNFYEGLSPNQATADLINNAYLTMRLDDLTCGTKAFMNFPADLLEQEIPTILPKERIVVEIIESVEPTAQLIAACKKLVRSGYILALDDFVYKEEMQPLVSLAAIIKVELSSLLGEKQRQFFYKYRGKKLFVAEKLESRAEFESAQEMGFDLFQGYFFSKPKIIAGKEIRRLSSTLIEIITELDSAEPDYQIIAAAIQRDLSLVYKLLKLANSVTRGAIYRINSIEQALVRIGLAELKKWVYLMILMDTKLDWNRELIKTCLVRGKLMEGIALRVRAPASNFSFFLTGLFSSIDAILSRPMDDIVKELPLPLDVSEALLGSQNKARTLLECVLAYERAEWDKLETKGFFTEITPERFMLLYFDVLEWVSQLNL